MAKKAGYTTATNDTLLAIPMDSANDDDCYLRIVRNDGGSNIPAIFLYRKDSDTWTRLQVTDNMMGTISLDDDRASPSNSGLFSHILDWLAGRLKAITGKPSWLTAPAMTIEDIVTALFGKVATTGNETVAGNKTLSGVTTFSNATESTSATTGAAIVSAGGLGVIGNVNIDGFTKLGDATIKVKYITGTTGDTEGGFVTVAHGLTPSKIIACLAAVEYSAGDYIGPGYTGGYFYNVSWGATVNIVNKAGDSANILSKPCRWTVFYIP